MFPNFLRVIIQTSTNKPKPIGRQNSPMQLVTLVFLVPFIFFICNPFHKKAKYGFR